MKRVRTWKMPEFHCHFQGLLKMFQVTLSRGRNGEIMEEGAFFAMQMTHLFDKNGLASECQTLQAQQVIFLAKAHVGGMWEGTFKQKASKQITGNKVGEEIPSSNAAVVDKRRASLLRLPYMSPFQLSFLCFFFFF